MSGPFLTSQSGLSRVSALGLCFAAALLVAWFIYVVSRPVPEVTVPEHAELFQEVNELPELSDEILSGPGLKTAIKRSLACLERKDQKTEVDIANRKVTVERLKAGLESFLDLLEQGLPAEDFRQRLLEEFHVYRVSSCGSGKKHPGPVFVTGYFQPVIPASHERGAEFSYPVFSVPDDLLQIDLGLFDSNLPSRRLYGRVSDRKVVPYYSRAEIDSGKVKLPAQVLAWLPSSIDGLMLHIQGSGLLMFPDGERRYIHYAASNGRPYGSIGKWLVKKGWLSLEEADWPGIKKWASQHPERFRDALEANPRYIFFRWEKEGPVGSSGAVLVPMRSVAMDPKVFPAGSLCFLDIPKGPYGSWSFSGFVLNQDVGSAIKGPCRVDLYCGEGDEAGRIAGQLRHRGNLYLILKK